MIKTTGDLRKQLADCFFLARDGKLSGDGLRGVIGCANQINISLSNEAKMRAQLIREGSAVDALGDMPIGVHVTEQSQAE